MAAEKCRARKVSISCWRYASGLRMVLLMVSVRYVLQLGTSVIGLLEASRFVDEIFFRLGLRGPLHGLGDLDIGRDFDIDFSHAIIFELETSSGGDEESDVWPRGFRAPRRTSSRAMNWLFSGSHDILAITSVAALHFWRAASRSFCRKSFITCERTRRRASQSQSGLFPRILTNRAMVACP